jgi:hypothetical protein
MMQYGQSGCKILPDTAVLKFIGIPHRSEADSERQKAVLRVLRVSVGEYGIAQKKASPKRGLRIQEEATGSLEF